jgi:uncharacterized membrane protein YbaN (DUF454 family)
MIAEHMNDDSSWLSREPSDVDVSGSRIMRLLWITAGTISLAVGIIGVVVPVLPTTPFVLIAAACYLRGSKRMYDWMASNRIIGGYLRDYLGGRGVSMRAKAISITILWALILLSAAFAVSDAIMRAVLLVVAVAVTLHLLTLKTRT